MNTRPGQFVIWTLIYAAGALLTYFVVRRRKPDFSLRDLPLPYGALMVVLWALHPLAFRVPNNFRYIDRSGWFGFWFSPRRAMDMELEAAFVATAGVFALALALMLATVYVLSRKRQARRALAYWSFPFWYLAAQCLTVPGRELIAFSHFTMIEGLGDIPGLLKEEPRAAGALLTPLALGMASLALAMTLNLWGSRSEETDAPEPSTTP
jgi:hypothetical protein